MRPLESQPVMFPSSLECWLSWLAERFINTVLPQVRTPRPAPPPTTGGEIQGNARVFDLADGHGSTPVGIMAGYDPKSHGFWWRSLPFIAEPSTLEGYFGVAPSVVRSVSRTATGGTST